MALYARNQFGLQQLGKILTSAILALCWVSITSVGQAQSTTNLILKLDFETPWSTTGVLVDQSGKGNQIDCQLALNQCPSEVLGPDGGKAANFQGVTYNPLSDSDYFALSNHARFKNMATGSISAWVKYDDGSSDGQVLDSWEYSPGTWRLGRYWRAKYPDEGKTLFVVTPSRPTDAKDSTRIAFPDAGIIGSWNHYAVTWDGNIFKGYFNGSYIGQAKQTGPLSSNRFYLSIGAFGHYIARNAPDPAHSTTFPNNGFHNGGIDDLRMYSSALTAQEVWKLFSKTNPIGVCGNGTIQQGEECDDGNLVAGDGCSQCALENGYSCSNTPSSCLRFPIDLYSALTDPSPTAGKYKINLRWTDTSTNEDGFLVERRVPGGTWLEIGNSGAQQNFYNDEVDVGSNQFYYRVRSRKEGQYSEYSNIARVYPTQSPINLQITSGDSSKVALSWNNRSSISRSVLEYRVGGEPFVALNESLSGTTYQDIQTFSSGKTYSYRVCIFHDMTTSCSGYSNIVEYSPPASPQAPMTPQNLRLG